MPSTLGIVIRTSDWRVAFSIALRTCDRVACLWPATSHQRSVTSVWRGPESPRGWWPWRLRLVVWDDLARDQPVHIGCGKQPLRPVAGG